MNIDSIISFCLDIFQIALQHILKDTNLIKKVPNVNGTVFQSTSTRKDSRLNQAMHIATKQKLTDKASYQYAKKDELKVSQATERDQPKNVGTNAKEDESDVSQITENDQSKNVETRNWSRRENIQGEKVQEQLDTNGIKQDGSELDFDTRTGKIMDMNHERM